MEILMIANIDDVNIDDVNIDNFYGSTDDRKY